MVGDVESYDRILAVRGCTFDDDNFRYLSVLAKIVVGAQRRDQLFLCKAGIHVDDIDNIPLHNTNVGKMSSPQRIQILALSLSLFLLLRQTLVVFLVDWLELNGFVCVLSSACGASTVEVFLDVMPTEATNLISTRAWSEVGFRYIHLFETERAFLVLRLIIAPVRILQSRKDTRLGLDRCGAGLENGGGQGWMSIGSGGHWLIYLFRRNG